jgi:hypothetical protein
MNNPLSERMQWTALTMLGLIAGLAIALPLGAPIFGVLGAMAGTPVVLGIVGLILGGAQWPVMRRHINLSKWWILASSVGMAIGLTAGVVTVEQIGRAIVGGPLNFRMLNIGARALSFATIGMMGGTCLGVAQWLVLRHVAQDCKRWIIANGASLALGLACGSLIADAAMMRTGSLAEVGVMLLIGSAAMGTVTSRLLPSAG